MKKMKKLFAAEQRKQDKNQKSLVSLSNIHTPFNCISICTHVPYKCLCILFILQEEAARNREQNLEEAKSITISEDTSLPAAKKVSY